MLTCIYALFDDWFPSEQCKGIWQLCSTVFPSSTWGLFSVISLNSAVQLNITIKAHDNSCSEICLHTMKKGLQNLEWYKNLVFQYCMLPTIWFKSMVPSLSTPCPVCWGQLPDRAGSLPDLQHSGPSHCVELVCCALFRLEQPPTFPYTLGSSQIQDKAPH